MSTKGSESGSLSRAIAGLEAVDKQLTDLTERALDGASTAGPIRESSALVQAAIRTLSLAQQATAVDEAGTAKRRVKIKAESQTTQAQTTQTLAPISTDSPGRSGGRGKGAAKAAARGNDREPATPQPTSAKDVPASSLLARLGAAVSESADLPPSAVPSVPSARTAPTVETALSADDTAERLARLEAEIAGLTEAPLAGNSEKTSPAAQEEPQELAVHTAALPAPDNGDVDDDDAEIFIVGANGAISDRNITPPRASPRVSHDMPTPGEDEAEVEIVQPGTGTEKPAAEKPGAPRLSARIAMTPVKPAIGSRWRLFRGSS